jgi:hypothetical protein
MDLRYLAMVHEQRDAAAPRLQVSRPLLLGVGIETGNSDQPVVGESRWVDLARSRVLCRGACCDRCCGISINQAQIRAADDLAESSETTRRSAPITKSFIAHRLVTWRRRLKHRRFGAMPLSGFSTTWLRIRGYSLLVGAGGWNGDRLDLARARALPNRRRIRFRHRTQRVRRRSRFISVRGL